jgi:hypothetical protein
MRSLPAILLLTLTLHASAEEPAALTRIWTSVSGTKVEA